MKSGNTKTVMEQVDCILCGPSPLRKCFTGHSRQGEPFDVMRCRTCGLEFVSPRPDVNSIGRYYTQDYFTRRDDRGYNNYYSQETSEQIERVLALNLEDLGFPAFEQEQGTGRVLDIGCAAGYSVRYMEKRGWTSTGIDIASGPVAFGQELGLDLIQGDYLSHQFQETFDLVTMWASIEHLHNPHHFIKKVYDDLRPGGMLYLSTCRTGGINFKIMFGKNWRFYNPPEHLYYFSIATIRQLLEQYGFSVKTVKTYGSGFGRPGTWVRRVADWKAKNLGMGDMMIVAAEKTKG